MGSIAHSQPSPWTNSAQRRRLFEWGGILPPPLAMLVHCAWAIPVSKQITDIVSDKPRLTIQGHDPHRTVVDSFHCFIHVLLLQ